MKYVLGLDLGITSIGWAVLGLDEEGDTTHIIDTNVTLLESMEDDKGNLKNAVRREARGARRLIRRRAYRVKRVKDLLEKQLGLEMDNFFNIPKKILINPYALKVKGLNEKLSNEELAIILVHYAKHRGYRSNRKNDKLNEDSALLGSINENENILKEENITYSQYIYKYYLKSDNVNFIKIKNTEKEYKYLFNRATVQDEIEKVLNKQVEFKVIDEEFKNKYIDIWGSQRDFSEGPDKPSRYRVNFAKVFGYCKFELDGERYLRAPKCAPTTEIFTLLQKLNNIRFSLDGKSGLKFTPEQIEKIFAYVKTKKDIKYSDIDKALGINAKYENISVSKDKYVTLLINYKKSKGLEQDDKVDTKSEEYQEYFLKELKKQKVADLKNYHNIRKVFKECGYESTFESMPIEYLDDLVTCLTFYKTENRINAYFSGESDTSNDNDESTELDWSIFPAVIDDVVPNLPNFSDSANLSLPLMRKLNEKLIKGIEYDKAMLDLGLDHSKPVFKIEKSELLPSINVIQQAFPNELTNPRVVRVLAYTIKTVNAIIKKYGKPENINIEVARDIANTLDKRRKMENEMLNNYEYNERVKVKLLTDFPEKFITFKDIKKMDLEKIKLYEEQAGMCMYSLKNIPYDTLFSNDLQVDHIIPYSLCFNDSFSNKTLVYTKTNQEKGNRIPKDYFKNNSNVSWGQFVNNVTTNFKLSEGKKKAYLASELPDAMDSRSLNDTRFITKYVTKIFTNFLDFEGKVNSYNGKVVNMLKKSYGLGRLAHSLENENYTDLDLFVFSKYEVNLKDVSLKFTFKNKQTNLEREISIKKVNETEKTPKFIKEQNAFLQKVLSNTETLSEFLDSAEGFSTYQLIEKLVGANINTDLTEAFLSIFNKLHIEENKQNMKKNRNNHFHHALDAVVTACMTTSLLQRVTSFHKKLEHFEIAASKALAEGKLYEDSITGQTISAPEDIESHKLNIIKNQFELPYPKFVEEVKYRIYEVDVDVQKKKFEAEFNDGLYRNIRPVMPVFFAKKREDGKLHKETIYGITNDGKNLTKRISVEGLNKKKLEKILYKEDRAKETYNAVKKWLESKGSDKPKYPTLPNGRIIKKVTIEDRDATKAVKVKGGYAATDLVSRIDIYQSDIPGDERLYFVQRHAYNIAEERRGDDFNVTLWWGQGESQKQLKFSELNSYKIVSKFYPGDLVNIETKSGNGKCYVKGFSSGKLEVGSVIGDAYDLVYTKNALCKSFTSNDVYIVTVSTINTIQKVKINMLGELDSHE